jgi:GTP-binding protein EngB required for normal cell division
VSVVLELLDAKSPLPCIDQEFRKQCEKHKVTVISVLTKTDTVSKAHLERSLKEA